MAPDCAYSIAQIKDIGAQLWQDLSKALGERVTKKNLFLVLKQYILSRTDETVASDELSVTLELVEIIDPPLTPTTNQLPVTTELVKASYSEDSKQLPHRSDRCYLVTEEDDPLERLQQEYQTFYDRTEAKNNLKTAVTRSELTIPSDGLPLDFPFYINHPPIEKLTYTQISQPRCFIDIKAPKLRWESSLLCRILTRIYLNFQEADVAISAELNQFLGCV